MIEPPQLSRSDKPAVTNRLQVAIFDKIVVSAEGRVAIMVAAVIVISIAFIWMR